MKQKNILFTDMDGTILFSDNGKTYFTEKLYGMSFHFKDNKSAKAFADWLEKSDHQEVRAFVNIQDVDMAWRDCSKGNAMNILCQKLGFMHEQVYAIGDAENDIDMLRATKHGYTFHHSPATVKQYAEGCVRVN